MSRATGDRIEASGVGGTSTYGEPVGPVERLVRPVRRWRAETRRRAGLGANRQLRWAAPGHFYSPLPDVDALRRHREDYPDADGIDLREAQQLDFLGHVADYYDELPFGDSPGGTTRFGYRNPFFGHSDAITLYTMMRHFQPARIIEVGSGFSSAAMLDVRERFLPDLKLTFVEPYPDRLMSLLRDADQYELLQVPVQQVARDRFAALEENDILFIDSSHVTKSGSDVNDLFFRVLPQLAPGVLVHVHDVLWPFEYPMPWLEQGRAWNEAYLLRGFLQFNANFHIVYFNDFMGRVHREAVAARAPLMLEETGGSIWLRRVA